MKKLSRGWPARGCIGYMGRKLFLGTTVRQILGPTQSPAPGMLMLFSTDKVTEGRMW
jgi:hypothetical protein